MNFLQELIIFILFLQLTIGIADKLQKEFPNYNRNDLSYFAHDKPTNSFKSRNLITKKHKWKKSYYSNTSASYNLPTTTILVCGDVHPNPGPTLSSPRKQAGLKLNSLRTLYLNAFSLRAIVESPEQRKSASRPFFRIWYISNGTISYVCVKHG